MFAGVHSDLLLFFRYARWRYNTSSIQNIMIPYTPSSDRFKRIHVSVARSTTSRSWTMFDSCKTIQREGWSIRKDILHAMRPWGLRILMGEGMHISKNQLDGCKLLISTTYNTFSTEILLVYIISEYRVLDCISPLITTNHK